MKTNLFRLSKNLSYASVVILVCLANNFLLKTQVVNAKEAEFSKCESYIRQVAKGKLPLKQEKNDACKTYIDESIEVKVKDLQKDYNKDLVNTVFLSVLGTTVTLASILFTFNFLSNVLSREREKESLKAELIDELSVFVMNKIGDEIVQINQNYIHSIQTIQTSLKLLEYEVTSLSVELFLVRGEVQSDELDKHLMLALKETSRIYMILAELAENDISFRDVLQDYECTAFERILLQKELNNQQKNKIKKVIEECLLLDGSNQFKRLFDLLT